MAWSKIHAPCGVPPRTGRRCSHDGPKNVDQIVNRRVGVGESVGVGRTREGQSQRATRTESENANSASQRIERAASGAPINARASTGSLEPSA
jgi:hypothetical protein